MLLQAHNTNTESHAAREELAALREESLASCFGRVERTPQRKFRLVAVFHPIELAGKVRLNCSFRDVRHSGKVRERGLIPLANECFAPRREQHSNTIRSA